MEASLRRNWSMLILHWFHRPGMRIKDINKSFCVFNTRYRQNRVSKRRPTDLLSALRLNFTEGDTHIFIWQERWLVLSWNDSELQCLLFFHLRPNKLMLYRVFPTRRRACLACLRRHLRLCLTCPPKKVSLYQRVTICSRS